MPWGIPVAWARALCCDSVISLRKVVGAVVVVVVVAVVVVVVLDVAVVAWTRGGRSPDGREPWRRAASQC